MIEAPEIFTVDGLKRFLMTVNFMVASVLGLGAKVDMKWLIYEL